MKFFTEVNYQFENIKLLLTIDYFVVYVEHEATSIFQYPFYLASHRLKPVHKVLWRYLSILNAVITLVRIRR